MFTWILNSFLTTDIIKYRANLTDHLGHLKDLFFFVKWMGWNKLECSSQVGPSVIKSFMSVNYGF